ncbi:MAG: filamentous hemagglutinin N-terminal domain-containing protein, partial [Thermoleophilia bacterium]|nr:filamentous hemagglutinin N-terminal domain-containing protein [Thermoleophilia bacterium]
MAQRRRRTQGQEEPDRALPALLFAVMLGGFFPGAAARADVVRDGRVGSAGAGAVATEIGSGGELRYLIRESDGQRVGNNLFHSFSRLDLTRNEAAVYQGAPEIRNLITSITGGRYSIDGQIKSEIAGANLFLINPDGIVFGENATVDLSGALTVSTADRLVFSNG